jgi:hypothetical protein
VAFWKKIATHFFSDVMNDSFGHAELKKYLAGYICYASI